MLISLGSFFEEVAATIGKLKVLQKEQSVYTLAFLSLFWGTIFFLVITLVRHQEFVFSLASLPTFIPRIFFEIFQTHVTVLGIAYADRSTTSFIRMATIPLLLIADISLGYHISSFQFIGIFIILSALVFIFLDKTLDKKGAHYALLGAVNAVVTISLYKYDIAHYNSIAAEQLIVSGILLIYFFLFANFFLHENPIVFLRRRIFFVQSFSDGLGSVVQSFAYGFAPASVILAGKRSSAALWAVISGNRYFGEQQLFLRVVLLVFIVIGLVFLAL